jgi:putative ABC transport system permease protein
VTAKLVLENIKHKPMRSLLSILLIGVPVTLILTLVGLSHGMLDDAERRARGSGADIMVRGPNATAVLSATNATLSETFLTYFAKQPHVVAVMGVIAHAIELPLYVNGVDLDQFNKMSGGMQFLSGGPFQGPDDVILDRYYAQQKKKKVGDTITIMNHDWRISGIVEGGQLAHILAPLRTVQKLDSATGKLTLVYLKVDDPRNIQTVIDSLKQQLGSNYPIWSMEEFTSQLRASVNSQGLNEFIGVIVGIGVVIGFAVVCLSMYMSVLQRTREIGILKSLGGSKLLILRIIWLEALGLGLGGTALGIIMSYGARWAIEALKPASFQVQMVYIWWPIAGAITLAGASLGALYPGISAASHDPIEALAYE